MVGSRRPGRGDQQQQGAGRRLLEDLQQRVGGVAVHLVGAVDDDDPPAAPRRRQAQEAAELAHVVDDDLAAQPPASRIIGALDRQQVGMTAARRRGERRCSGMRSRALEPVGRRRTARLRLPPLASRKRAKRKASVALPMPRGPGQQQACGSRPASARRRSVCFRRLVAEQAGFARGAGAPRHRCRRHRPRHHARGGDAQALARPRRGQRGAPSRRRPWRRSRRSARVVCGDLRGNPRAAARGTRVEALVPVGSRRAAARASPISTGRSRIRVRSGAKSPSARRCSSGQVGQRRCPGRSPDRPGSNRRSGRQTTQVPGVERRPDQSRPDGRAGRRKAAALR